jgi:hypothetical protein
LKAVSKKAKVRARRALTIAGLSVASLGFVFTGVVGFLHTKPGRPLLSLVFGSSARSGGKCPLGYDTKVTPEDKEAQRRQFAAVHAGRAVAQGRPAFGFELDKTTRGDVLGWAATHDVQCKTPKSGADLDCSDVPVDALPSHTQVGGGFHSLWFTFGAGDKLISAVGVRRDTSVESISSTFRSVTSALTNTAGPPVQTQGDPSPATLSSGALYQASVEYRFRNYFALARATNMGPVQGYVLTEEYRSLPDS